VKSVINAELEKKRMYFIVIFAINVGLEIFGSIVNSVDIAFKRMK